MSALKQLSEWVADAPSEWSESSNKIAIEAFVDTAACMIAGSVNQSTCAVERSVADNSGMATAVTGGGPYPATFAALINGTAAHALDFDDVLEGANTHASAVLVPALLALGSERASPGTACIDAYLVGIEVMACIGRSLDLTHYTRGWHATSTIGTVAAAAACARLLALPPTVAGDAISLAVSMSSGTKAQFGTAAKPFHAGMAAMNGILAAKLAEAGLEAGDNILDGPWGLNSLYGGNQEKSIGGEVGSLGADTAHVLMGIRQKAYPCCFSNHQAIVGATRLRKTHKLTSATIAKVDVELPTIYSDNLVFRNPSTIREAQFCLEYCLSAALINGGVSVDDFTDSAIASPEKRALMSKIHRVPIIEGVSDTSVESAMDVTVKIFTHDGDCFTECVSLPPTLKDAELREKFLSCSEAFLPTAKAWEIYKKINGMVEVKDIVELNSLLSLGSSFKCNTQSPLGIGCCDGHTKQAPQQRGTWRDISRA